MMISRILKRLALLNCLLFWLALAVAAQQPTPTKAQQDDVIRIDTALVQTSVTVFDKRGNFVEGLRPEDFVLRVDGRPVSVSFFSRVTAGTPQEREALAAVQKGTSATVKQSNINTEAPARTVIFFLDDLHLSASSVQRTRQTILDFINNKMSSGDLVAVASASGQIGFLQQFTDNKAVLRAAVGRLNHRPYTVIDNENVPMTEYSALRIDQGDRDAITYYTNQLLLANNFRSPGGSLGPPAGGPAGSRPPAQRSSGLSREMAERMVRERALVLLKQGTAVTTNTLASLESLLRSSVHREGRKLVFFVSDGFYLNDRNTGFVSKLHELTDAAVRAGIVIYSLDARGLTSTIDVTSNRADPEGKLARSNVGELIASQDGLNALAGDTGGRALFDSDKLNEAVEQALRETSNYYLLAWRPTTEEQTSSAFRKIEVTLPTRADLSVRLPRGYMVNAVTPTAATNAGAPVVNTENRSHSVETVVDVDLKRTLSASYSETLIPTIVAATFVDTPDNGPVVTASVQTAATALDYGPDGKQAAVDVAGVILNDQGKAAGSFRTRLTVGAVPVQLTTENAGVVYNYKAKLAPGLYQVRAAVRDEKSGRVGSASQWLEIPDLSAHRLALSSLLLRSFGKSGPPATAEAQFSVDHHFARSAQLSFLLFIYNAARETTAQSPNLTVQTEVFRQRQLVTKTPVRALTTNGITDLQRIPYGGQFPLEALPGGRYELRIRIVDQIAKTTAEQRVSFHVD